MYTYICIQRKIWCKLLLHRGGSVKAVSMPPLCISACDCGIKGERAARRLADLTLMHNKLNAWTQIGDGVAVHFQIAYLTKNKRWRCATTEHSTPPSFPPVQLSSVQTRQALRAQTITIPKRLIPSVDQSYRFPSEKAESEKKSLQTLIRHWQ